MWLKGEQIREITLLAVIKVDEIDVWTYKLSTFSANLSFAAVTTNKYANRKEVNLRREILSLPVSQPRLTLTSPAFMKPSVKSVI